MSQEETSADGVEQEEWITIDDDGSININLGATGNDSSGWLGSEHDNN